MARKATSITVMKNEQQEREYQEYLRKLERTNYEETLVMLWWEHHVKQQEDEFDLAEKEHDVYKQANEGWGAP
jgi:hypothetical protein